MRSGRPDQVPAGTGLSGRSSGSVAAMPNVLSSVAAAFAAEQQQHHEQQQRQRHHGQGLHSQQSQQRPSKVPAARPAEPSPPGPQPLPQDLMRRARELARQLSNIHRYEPAGALSAGDNRGEDVAGDSRNQNGGKAGFDANDNAGANQPMQQAANNKKKKAPATADAADALVSELRSVLAGLRAAATVRRPPDPGSLPAQQAQQQQLPPQQQQQLSPEDASVLWHVAADLWNHAVGLANMEALRKKGMRAAANIAADTAQTQAATENDAAGVEDRVSSRQQRRQWRKRLLTHIARARQLAVEAVSLVPLKRLPPPDRSAGGGAAGVAVGGPAAAAVSEAQRRASFCFAAGAAWSQLRELESAELCLSRATPAVALLVSVAAPTPGGAVAAGGARAASAAAAAHAHALGQAVLSAVQREEILVEVFELQLERMRVLWRLGQQALARQALDESSALSQDLTQAGRYDLACVLTALLSQALLDYAVEVATGAPVASHTHPFDSSRSSIRGGGKGGRAAAAAGAQHLGNMHLLSQDEEEEGDGEEDEEGAGDAIGVDGKGGEGGEGGMPGRGALVRGGGLSDPAEAISLLDQVYELVTNAVQCHHAAVDAAAAQGGGGKPGEADVAREDGLVWLRDQVLVWLAQCHAAAGDPSASLSCVGALREAGSELAATPEMAAVEARCLAVSGSWDAAVAVLVGLARRGDAEVVLGWEVVEGLAEGAARAPLQALWPAVEALQRRMPYDASIVLRYLQIVYDNARAEKHPNADLALEAADGLALRVLLGPQQTQPQGRQAAGGHPGAAAGAPGRTHPAAAVRDVLPAVARLQRRWGLQVQGGRGGGASAAGSQGERMQIEEGDGRGSDGRGQEQEADVDMSGDGVESGLSEEDLEELRYQAFALLWNRACQLFADRAWSAALALLDAAPPYAPGPQEAARAHQTAALCALAMQDVAGAMSQLDRAEAAVLPSPPPPQVTFLRFKVLLMAAAGAGAGAGAAGAPGPAGRGGGPAGGPPLPPSQAHAQAVALAPQLLEGELQQPGLLQVACQEAAGARAWPVVRELLLTLHRAAMQQPQQQQEGMDLEGAGEQEGPTKGAAGPDALTRALPSEGHILRLLVRCVMEEASSHQQQQQQQQQSGRPRSAGGRAAGAGVASGADGARPGTGGRGGGGGGGEGGGTEPQPHHDMALYCNLAAVRLDALGERAFFMGAAAAGREGEEQDPAKQQQAVQQQLEWFAWTSWNAGLAAVAAGAMQSGAVLLAAAGKLLGRLLGAVAVGPAEGGRPPAGGGGGAAAERVRGCRRVSFTLAAACALAVAARHTPAGPAAAAAAGPSSPDAAAALSLAAHTLRHAKAAAAERAAAAAAAGRPPPPPDKCDMHVALMELRLLASQRASPTALLSALEAAARTFPPGPACPLPPHDMLALAHRLRALAQAPSGLTHPAVGAAADPAERTTDPESYIPVAAAAYRQALIRLVSAGAPPPPQLPGGGAGGPSAPTAATAAARGGVGGVDWEAVAQVVHALLALAGGGDDSARLGVLRELAGLLDMAVTGGASTSKAGQPRGRSGRRAGSGNGEDVGEEEELDGEEGRPEGGVGGSGGVGACGFPQRDMEYLVGSTWNRGAHHARFGRTSLALDHLRVALRLLRHVPPLDAANRHWMAEDVDRLSAVGPVVEAAQAGEEERGLHTPLAQHQQQQAPGPGAPGAAGRPGAACRADGGGGSTGGRAVHGLLAPDT